MPTIFDVAFWLFAVITIGATAGFFAACAANIPSFFNEAIAGLLGLGFVGVFLILISPVSSLEVCMTSMLLPAGVVFLVLHYGFLLMNKTSTSATAS